ncbi:MAG: zinc ribbon domain-containing protein [Treponema sp.]|nr:zinc ribbon domain-containing protein [Treponema sp.]
MSNPSAKFFCESCGAEVPRNARLCKKCGRFFSSVRCPNCGATGTPDTFKNGCPKCGYTVDGNSNETENNKDEKVSRKTKNRFKSAIRSKSSAFNGGSTDETLPFWMYILTGLILIGLLFFIMHYFGR